MKKLLKKWAIMVPIGLGILALCYATFARDVSTLVWVFLCTVVWSVADRIAQTILTH